MSIFSYKNSSQRKRSLKYGGYMTITTLILLVALILINVLVSLLGWRVDMTSNDLYTPGEQTMDTLNKLEDPVTIYGLYNQGSEGNSTNAMVIKLMEAYAALSDKVTFRQIDPLNDPAFVNQFLMDDSTSLENGSLIVVNEGNQKFRTIPISNLFVDTGDYTNMTRTVTGFTAEEAVTSAIQYVCLDRTPVMYELRGHSETPLQQEFLDYFSYTNYEVKELNLVTENLTQIAGDAYTVILINAPYQDLNDTEYETLLSFMEDGGKILFLASYDTPEMPNFEKLLGRYGLGIQTGTMLETDTSRYYQLPIVINPILSTESDITKYLVGDTNSYVLMPLPAAVTVSDTVSSRIKIQPFVTTSEGAVIKGEGNNATVYEEGDLQGPFNLGVLAEETVSKSDGTVGRARLVVVGDSDFIDPTSGTGTLVRTGNYRLMTTIFDYLQDTSDSLYISGKSIEATNITTTQADFLLYGLIFVILMPAAIIVAGVVIWARRKHL
ncbi:MAG: Gldg family protein [Firmicutes bacterium]|nr:Gldg family protein [Bacillota bacterium]